MDALDHVLSKNSRAALVVTGTRRIFSEDTPPGNGTTILGSEFVTSGFGRITGTARSDVALTLNIYQGAATGTMDYVTAVAIPAAGGEGAGAAFTVEVVGEYARIDVVNAGAAGAVFSACAHLRGV